MTKFYTENDMFGESRLQAAENKDFPYFLIERSIFGGFYDND